MQDLRALSKVFIIAPHQASSKTSCPSSQLYHPYVTSGTHRGELSRPIEMGYGK
jgi:hypothetical protein